jgi:hypothetical protein
MKACSICIRTDRATIDAALVAQTSLRDIVTGHAGTSRSALDRHRKHIPAALTQAKQAVEVAEATTLLSRVESLLSRCETIFDKASAEKKWGGAVAAARELRGCLELIGKLSGELKTAGARIGINFGDIQSIDIESLTDEQLEALCSRLGRDPGRMRNDEILAELTDFALKVGIAGRTALEANLFDEETVAAPAGGNHVCWSTYFEKAVKWTPYRSSSPHDRFRMLQEIWKKVSGCELPDRVSMQEFGTAATIAIEFDLADQREEWWHSWPKVRLIVPFQTEEAEESLQLPAKTIQGGSVMLRGATFTTAILRVAQSNLSDDEIAQELHISVDALQRAKLKPVFIQRVAEEREMARRSINLPARPPAS